MSLNWSLSNCKSYETLVTVDEWPITESIICCTMTVGVPSLRSEADVERYYKRYVMWCMAVYGDYLPGVITGVATLSDIRKRMGLSTNASKLTDAQFRKHVAQVAINHYSRKADKLYAEETVNA